MATVYVSIGKAGVLGRNGYVPVYVGAQRSETITSSSSNAAGTITANAGDIAMIYCQTGSVWASTGTAATKPSGGTAGNGVLVPALMPVYLSMSLGDTINVIDV